MWRKPRARGPKRESSACRLPASEVARRVSPPKWPPPLETRSDTGLNRGGRGGPDRSDRRAGPGWDERPGRCRPPRADRGQGARRAARGLCSAEGPPAQPPHPAGRSPSRAPPSPGRLDPAAGARRARAGRRRSPGSRGRGGEEKLCILLLF